MNRYFNVENTTVVEQAETAGACAGFITGAAVGAKVASSTFWWLGPVAYPTTIIGSTLVLGAIGAIGGANLGKAIITQMNS